MVHFDKNEELMTSVTASENETVKIVDGRKIEITTVSDLLFANRIMEDSLVYQ